MPDSRIRGAIAWLLVAIGLGVVICAGRAYDGSPGVLFGMGGGFAVGYGVALMLTRERPGP